MKRDHILRFVTTLTAFDSTTPEQIGSAAERASLKYQTLQKLLEAFPEQRRGESVYERLCHPPDLRRLALFKLTIQAIGDVAREGANPTESHYRWAAHVLETAQRPLVRTPPEVARIIPRPSSAQALWCLSALEALVRNEPLSADARRRLSAEMADVIAAWGDSVYLSSEDGACPDCATGYLQELDATLHMTVCVGHPALARLEARREAARLVGVELDGRVEGVRAPQPRTGFGSEWEAKSALERLLKAPATRRPSDPPPVESLALLRRVAREWAHFVDRTTDPCPWCAQVLPLAQMHGHLRSCSEHPAEKAGQRVRASGLVPVGLEQLVLNRVVARRELKLLSQASETFNTDMGWTGEAGYSDQYTETPWRAAIARAGKFLGLPARTPVIPRPAASPVREAMTRLLNLFPPSPAVTVADIETLRAAATQFDQWATSLRFATTCPACRRKGIPQADLAGHLETCPLHPAVRGARAHAALPSLPM